MSYRISDLFLLVIATAAVLGLIVSVRTDEPFTAIFSVGAVLAVIAFIRFRAELGTMRCPYCESWTIRLPAPGIVATCEHCGSKVVRAGRSGCKLSWTPADERAWVGNFLPKLGGLRRDLRPGNVMTNAEANELLEPADSHF